MTKDGTFDVRDIVAMTRWIHLSAPLAAPAAGDADGDGRLDVLDLAYMKRALTKK